MPALHPHRSLPLPACCRALPARFGRANTVLLGVLLTALIGGLVFLLDAEKPWKGQVQKRLSRGQDLQLGELVSAGLWIAALIGVVALAGLLATHRWWLPRPHDHAQASRKNPVGLPRQSWWFPLLTLLAMGLCLWQGLPRLGHSLWNDEEYAIRRYVHGEWEERGGSWEFDPASWRETLFLNRQGNNHLLNSVFMRAANAVWHLGTGAPADAFSEAALRLPSFLAGIATIACVALLGRLLAGPWVGVAAAFLLTLNPWDVHYATDAKGYSELLLFLVLHFIGLVKALNTNRLRWWLLFGFAEAAYLLCFSGSLYVAITTNTLALLELLRRGSRSAIPTLIAVNLIAAIPVLLWITPSVPQYLAYVSKPDALRLGMGWPWVRDLLSSLYLGFPYDNPGERDHFGSSWKLFQQQHSLFIHTVLPLLIIPLLTIVGLAATVCRGRDTRLVILGPLLGAVLSFCHNASNNNPMVVWYFVFLLPMLAILLSLGLATLCRGHRFILPILLVLFVSIYGVSVADASHRKRHYDRQPIRQTARWIQDQHPDPLAVTWGVSDNQSRSYIPRARAIHDLTQLHASEQEALAKKVPLYVFIAGEKVTATRDPELTGYLTTSSDYRLVARFAGLEELFSYRVYEWLPASANAVPPSASPAAAQSQAPPSGDF